MVEVAVKYTIAAQRHCDANR